MGWVFTDLCFNFSNNRNYGDFEKTIPSINHKKLGGATKCQKILIYWLEFIHAIDYFSTTDTCHLKITFNKEMLMLGGEKQARHILHVRIASSILYTYPYTV